MLNQQEIIQYDKHNDVIYQETPYRFYVFISYCLMAFANGLQWVTFSSCAENFGKAYSLKSWEVNMFSLIYMILYPIACIPQGYLIDGYSTRLGLILAALFTLIGSLLKCFVNRSMIIVFIGQFLPALVQPAILNSPGKIAATWFRVDVRNLITAICCISDTIGILFGFVFHVFIIDDSLDLNTDTSQYKEQFAYYLFLEFILNCILCLPTLFILKNKPHIPPSASQDKENEPGFKESFKSLFHNKRFIYLLISSSLILGYYSIYGTILNSYMFAYNVNDSQSSYIYGISTAVGITCSLIISSMLDKYKKYKLFLLILVLIGVVFHIIFTILLELSLIHSFINAFISTLILYSLIAISYVSFYTIAFNYVCEITYPIGESLTGALIMSSSQIVGIIGTFGCDYLMNGFTDKKYLSNMVLGFFYIIALCMVGLLDEKLIRSEIDMEGNVPRKNESIGLDHIE